MSIRKIPSVAYKTLHNQQNINVHLDPKSFNDQLYIWDAFDAELDVGFLTKEDFVSRVIQTQANVEFDILLQISKTFPPEGYKTMWNTERTSVSPDEKDIASFVFPYSIQELFIQDELPTWNQKLHFASKVDLRHINTPEELQEVEIFMIEGVEPFKNQNGIVIYTKLRIKQIVSYKTTKQNIGDQSTPISYVVFNWRTQSLQPLNAKYVSFKFASKPALFHFEFLTQGAIALNYEITNDTQELWSEHLLPWVHQSNQATFKPIWSSEFAYAWDTSNGYTYNWWNGGSAFGENNTRTTNDDGFLEGWHPVGTDFIDFIKGIPNQNYRVSDIRTMAGNWNDEPITLMLEARPYIIPNGYSLFQGGTIKSVDDIASDNIPRNGNIANGYWIQKANTSLYIWDLAYTNAYFPFVGSGTYIWYHLPLRNDKVYTNIENHIPYFTSTTRIENKAKILRRTLIWNGISFTELPPARFDFTVDISGEPYDWDTSLLTKTIALYPQEISSKIGIENISGGVSVSETSQIDGGLTTFYAFTRLKYKTLLPYNNMIFSSSIWYFKENKEYKITLKLDPYTNNEFLINQYTMIYFGGYEYIIEWLDKDMNPAVALDINNDQIPLTPQLIRAQNRKGDPLSTTETTIFGSTRIIETNSSAKKILKEQNETKDKLSDKINIKTGKNIKVVKTYK